MTCLPLRVPALAAALAATVFPALATSASARYCDQPTPLTARQQDRLLRFADVVRGELEASGRSVALVSRSGLDLERFRIRYSHAGVSLKASANGPWSVRQLYYACDEGRPRLYDQGLAGFLFGTDDPAIGYASIVLLPRAQGDALEAGALDKLVALRLLAADYSANAHAFSLRYQNCNQWVMELIATAWGALADGDDLRARAQRWLADAGYAPRPVEVGSHALMMAAGVIPWIHLDDHPQADLFALRLSVSLPESIETFVRERAPGAQRIELCHDQRRIVVRRGWKPIDEGCTPGPDDRVLLLD